MPIHFVQVIRELTDSVSYYKDKRSKTFCSDVEQEASAVWSPNTDIVEYKDRVIIKMELAGVAREDISVKVRNGKIRVCGIRHEKQKSGQAYHQLEIQYGQFVKDIYIPEFLEHNPIQANLLDGILEVSISKASEIVEIPINEGSGQEG